MMCKILGPLGRLPLRNNLWKLLLLTLLISGPLMHWPTTYNMSKYWPNILKVHKAYRIYSEKHWCSFCKCLYIGHVKCCLVKNAIILQVTLECLEDSRIKIYKFVPQLVSISHIQLKQNQFFAADRFPRDCDVDFEN